MTGYGAPTSGDPAHAWVVLADTLLQREALVCRLGDGVVPHDFAGLYVGHEEVDRILAGLPGLGGPPREAVDALLRDLDPVLATARAAFAEELAGATPFARIVRAAGLDTDAAEVLALLVAVDLSPHRMRLAAYLQDNVQLPRLTLGTIARIFAGTVRALAPQGALRRTELVEVSGDGPWANRGCHPAERVVWALRGDDSPDPGLPAGTVRRDAGAVEPVSPAEVLLVTGADAESRLRQVELRWPGRPLLVGPAPRTAHEWIAVVREATVGGRIAVVEIDPATAGAGYPAVDRATHVTWVLSSPAELALETLPIRPWREVRVEPGAADTADWYAALRTEPDPAFRLTRTQLRLVAAAAGGDADNLEAAVRRLAGGHLDSLALRVRPRRRWSDLVLPRDQTDRLRELAARHRRRTQVQEQWGFAADRSAGMVALFSGPSGTGKTLAAEVVAGELGLDLYKVDLSSVVSKYIGETEKNLERIFDAATAGDLVLFFDEADAIFGKRSEVSDAHDRYANIEVAYLLQRLETYPGIVILATNLQRNIDQAFLRRISVAVDFEPPAEAERRLIWQGAFPVTAPMGDLDFDFLARQFQITGGVISNAAVGAAYLAAEEDGKITMERIARALKREFQKLGRLRTKAEFERYFDLVTGGDDAAPPR